MSGRSGSVPTPLSPGLYASGKGYGYVFERINGVLATKGDRVGDWDKLELNIEVTETPRYSNESPVKVRAINMMDEISATGSATLVQLSTFARRAALMGKSSVRTQPAVVDRPFEFDEPGHYFLGVFGVTSVTGTKADPDDPGETIPIVAGTDYILHPDGGILEVLVPLACAVSAPEISNQTAICIAAGTGIRGAFLFVGTNRQGQKVRLWIHDVEIRPAGARSYIQESGLSSVEVTLTAFPDFTQPEGYEIGWEEVIE